MATQKEINDGITDRWYLVKNDKSFGKILSDMQTKHQKSLPKAKISIIQNKAKTEALIKVRGGGRVVPFWKLWRLTKVIKTYTIKDHSKVKILLKTPKWQK